jgi:hypothetical protein
VSAATAPAAPALAARRVALAAAALAAAALAAGCLSKPGFECAIAPGAAQIEAELGTLGGVPSGSADCGDLAVVGVAFMLTHNLDAFGEKAAVTATLRCAAVTNHDGAYATGSIEEVPVPGGSEKNVDGPFVADCPSGQLVTGIAAHIVGDNGLFNSISITCAVLDPSGAPTDDVVQLPVAGTGTQQTKIMDAPCNPGESLHGLDAVSGSQLDRIKLSCGRTICARSP